MSRLADGRSRLFHLGTEPVLPRYIELSRRYDIGVSSRATIIGCAGVAELDYGSENRRLPEQKSARDLVWTSNRTFQGWTCSQCEWNCPLPTLLTDADARTAYDRLASAKFREHKCAEHLARIEQLEDEQSYTARIRKLVSQGFKPKDAVELFLQEISLEHRNDPKIMARAKSEGEDFLRRVKAGML